MAFDRRPVFHVCGDTVHVFGEIDVAVAGELRAAVGQVIATRPAGGVVVDLAAVTFLDAAGVAALLASQADAERPGVPWRAVNASAKILRTLRIAGVDGLAQPR